MSRGSRSSLDLKGHEATLTFNLYVPEPDRLLS